MRTTLTIDDYLMRQLKDLAHRSGQPLKKVVNDTLRAGLDHRNRLGPSKPYQCKTYAMGFPPKMNLDKALEIAAAMEDDEIARKLALRK
jgi:hypothetical protein